MSIKLPGPPGTLTQANRLANQLAKHGHLVIKITKDGPGDSPQLELEDGRIVSIEGDGSLSWMDHDRKWYQCGCSFAILVNDL